MALVIVLALTALLTVAIVAFFVRAISNRQIEASRAHRVQADVLARSGVDYVVARYQQEIIANSNPPITSDVKIYVPKTPADSVPQRRVSTPVSLGDANFFNLNRQSVSASSTNPAGASADDNASGDNVSVPAGNGRKVGVTQWNKPVLLDGGGFSDTKQLPNWIYMTADKGVASAATANVCGRFAYNVYNIGGLLNVNAAGFPTRAANYSELMTPDQLAKLKGTLAGLDLTQLPGVSQSAVNDLVKFRNPDASTNAAYVDCILASSQKGFINSLVTGTATFTNNYFASRQDLLHYAFTQNTPLAGSLPYLTHFSRAITAPVWSPAADAAGGFNYKTNAESSGTANRDLPNLRWPVDGTIAHYNDDGRQTSYTVKSGDPLIQRRFSLKKTAWLGPFGVNTAAFDSSLTATQRDAAIQACFGLKWDDTNKRWNYLGHTGSTLQTAIKTLDVVASENREPNFFECFKAGVLAGSMGSQDANAPAERMSIEANRDLQILRIGANAIDSADSDNYPTVLAMSYNNAPLEVAGVEDLPYLYGANFGGFWTIEPNATDKTKNKLTNLDAVFAPILFNPHQQSNPSSNNPAKLRMLMRGSMSKVTFGSGDYLLVKPTSPKDLSTLTPIEVPSTAYENFRKQPDAARSTSSLDTNTLSTLLSYSPGDKDTQGRDAQGFLVFSYEKESGKLPYSKFDSTPDTGDTGRSLRVFMQNVTVLLQYALPGTPQIYKTYATFAGNEAIPASGWRGTKDADGNYYTTFGPNYNRAGAQHTIFSETDPNGAQSKNATEFAITWDPRTGRVGPTGTRYRSLTTLPWKSAPNLGSTTPLNWNNYWWPQAGKLVTDPNSLHGGVVNNQDPDLASGVARPADGWLDDGANPYQNINESGANSLASARPVILQRAFQSVAELGYVFRDTPWKTLSFFDETSADGALLDLFAVQDEPAVTAGAVCLGSLPAAVGKALFQGSGQTSDGANPLTNASSVATALDAWLFSGGLPTSTMPLTAADLTNFLFSMNNKATVGLDKIKYHREAVIRSLADVGQNRTWNLLIDVVGQAGRFPPNNLNAGSFILEGEKHYWFSVAIDRYTGRVVDQQLEAIEE